MNAPEPLHFELTADEARVAASRAALRGALSDALFRRHFAPLVVFALWILFVAVLGLTGLISRRAAEIALIFGAAAFMFEELMTRRQFFKARGVATAWAERARTAGPLALVCDDEGWTLTGAALTRRWRYADGLEIEDAGGMIYLWPKSGEPAFWPTRAANQAAAAEWLAFAGKRMGAQVGRAVREEDDD